MLSSKMKSPLLIGDNVFKKKEEIKKYFLETISIEEELFSLLKPNAYHQKAIELRHPLIFYYGHTFTFYINKLVTGKFISERLDPELESMMAIGVDEMSWDDLREENYQWPKIEEVKNYRQKVTKLILDFIDETPLELPISWESPFWAILMGIEHHNIHVETSSVLIRQLPIDLIIKNENWAIFPSENDENFPPNTFVKIPEGKVSLGRKTNSTTLYGWDNEFGKHEANLSSFECSKFLVSNGEYLEFVKDGGYRKDEFWDEEGLAWKEYTQSSHPHFWRDKNGGFSLRVLDREISLPLSWPVEVNHLEVKAFCQWKSQKEKKVLRALTEDEWQRLFDYYNVSAYSGNINLSCFTSPCPVDQFSFGDLYDICGNVWQWTETPIYPFQGFQVHPIYDDFSVPTFDHKHHIMKGGSWISKGNEALPESRYAFRRHFFQHAGFRYVSSQNSTEISENPYETDQLLVQYCEFHYGDEYFGVPNFPKSCIKATEKVISSLAKREKALDLGCSLGRSSIELSKYFDEVVGLDYSARFIEKAQRILNEGKLYYHLPTEGDLSLPIERTVDFSEVRGKIEFYQADACNLSLKFNNFDFIFAGNLIDRLYSPEDFLKNIHNHLNAKGVLILTSPYTWLEEYTPKTKWIGGYRDSSGEKFTTYEGLHKILNINFEEILPPKDIPFVIRETQRKYQHTVAQMTLWRKK